MQNRDPRVDDYIAKAAAFAQPILDRLREHVHNTDADATESIKWGMPAFLHNGKILANMAAFKAHATFGIWSREGADTDTERATGAMGSLGRLTSVADLPADADLQAKLLKAIETLERGAPRKLKHPPKPQLPVPPALAAALELNPKAKAVFDAFAPSHRREYSEWIADAKRDETRDKRIVQTIEWLCDGKRRNWKYENC
jgi:uncharacterized protein YdeI (YjbR/CyaY-like superfamily)